MDKIKFSTTTKLNKLISNFGKMCIEKKDPRKEFYTITFKTTNGSLYAYATNTIHISKLLILKDYDHEVNYMVSLDELLKVKEYIKEAELKAKVMNTTRVKEIVIVFNKDKPELTYMDENKDLVSVLLNTYIKKEGINHEEYMIPSKVCRKTNMSLTAMRNAVKQLKLKLKMYKWKIKDLKIRFVVEDNNLNLYLINQDTKTYLKIISLNKGDVPFDNGVGGRYAVNATYFLDFFDTRSDENIELLFSDINEDNNHGFLILSSEKSTKVIMPFNDKYLENFNNLKNVEASEEAS